MVTVGIIGTAGRKDDAAKINLEMARFMYKAARDIIRNELKLSPQYIMLVSGGAACADSMAVKLYLAGEAKGLKLELPAKYTAGRFEENETGKTCNYYHQLFQKSTGLDSLGDIQKAIQQGAVAVTHNGFLTRNLEVAKSNILIAMTFGNEHQLKQGGTEHTWSHFFTSKAKKAYHINLNNRKTYFYANEREYRIIN